MSDSLELDLQALVNNATWVLGIKLGSSARVISTLHY